MSQAIKDFYAFIMFFIVLSLAVSVLTYVEFKEWMRRKYGGDP